MKRQRTQLGALLLSITLLLGCSAPAGPKLSEAVNAYQQQFTPAQQVPAEAAGRRVVPFSEMEYVHPDLDAMRAAAEKAMEAAAGDSLEAVLDAASDFEEMLTNYVTALTLSDIHTSLDLTDPYWSEENRYCNDLDPSVSQLEEQLYQALAASIYRSQLEKTIYSPGFFKAYDGESTWDDTTVALIREENELINRYYLQQASDCEFGSEEFYRLYGDDVAETLIQLIQVRKRIAEHAGFSSYAAFADAANFYRDFPEEQVLSLLDSIRRELVPLYRIYWLDACTDAPATEAETLQYVRSTAQAMGGIVEEAFSVLEKGRLYDISFNPNKFYASFENYLAAYDESFIFLYPEQTEFDLLTFSHEFGHYCNDFALDQPLTSIDVSEIYSQAMEYLSLRYHPEKSDLIHVKLADGLCTYVEQACYADFERRLYALPEEQLTCEGLSQLYLDTLREYGMDNDYVDSREYITIPHLYIRPMYLLSYIISNDTALQFYEADIRKPGNGLSLYETALQLGTNSYPVFLKKTGLESPFAAGRIEQVRQFFADNL